MPLPFRNKQTQIEAAVTSALEKQGVLTPRESAIEALNDAGADVSRLATELANLVFTAKEGTRHKAILDALALHGINIKAEQAGSSQPIINIAVQGENVDLQQLFAPERKF